MPTETQATPAPFRADSPPSAAVIEIENLVKTFDGRNVLDNVSLTVRRGETLVIMGASGCGKSTLLRCLIGSHRPDQGRIRLFGKDIWSIRSRELDGVRRRFGILFQSGALFSSMSVGENVALPLKEHTRLSADMVDLMVKVKLELVGLREAEDRLPSEISGGMAKRAGLARAIALDPELLFYDEPTSGLDPIMTGIIDGLIVDLARTMNVTSVVVTHDLKSAFRVADRMVVLNGGRIVQQGMPHEIRASTDPFVRRFIHGPVESRTAVLPRGALDRGEVSGAIPRPSIVTIPKPMPEPVQPPQPEPIAVREQPRIETPQPPQEEIKVPTPEPVALEAPTVLASSIQAAPEPHPLESQPSPTPEPAAEKTATGTVIMDMQSMLLQSPLAVKALEADAKLKAEKTAHEALATSARGSV